MIDWVFATLKQYPEIAIFLALAAHKGGASQR